MTHGFRRLILCTTAALLPVSIGLAGQDGAVTDGQIERLQAQLEAQQNRLDALQRQVASSSAQDADAARTDVMRQQIRSILGESEFRESLMSSTSMAGYDKGFFIRSSDDKFSLKINGQVQFRWTHYATRRDNRWLRPREQRNDRTGFDVQRLRLIVSGHAYDPNLTYAIWLRAEAPDGYDFRVHYAFVNYKFQDEIQLKAGVFRLASTRSQMMSDANFQLIDRPMADAVFGLGIGLGVRLWGQLFDKKLEYFVDVVNSLNSPGNRTITNDPAEHDNVPALLFRAVWHAMGEGGGKTFKVEGDIPKSDSLALDFGFHYAFNEDEGDAATTRIPFKLPRRFARGGFGLTNTNGLQINQFGFDTAFKYQGFSATAEYTIRIVDVRRAYRTPFTPLWRLTGDDSTTVMHGAYGQFGYFLPIPGYEDKIEAVVRVGGISTLAGGQEGTWEYAAGLNYYIEGNNVKLQTDFAKVSEVPISNNYSSLANVNDDALLFRVQLQVRF